MPSEGGERTEAPTPRRRSEAREKGQVAKSADLTSALLLLGVLLLLRSFGPRVMTSLMAAMRGFLTIDDAVEASTIDFGRIVQVVAFYVIAAAGPVMLGLAIIAVVGGLLQTGLMLTSKPLAPSWSRLNPLNGIGRLFSTRTLVQLAMNLVKLMLASAVAYSAVHNRMGEIMLAMGVGGGQQIVLLATVVYEVGIQLAMALLIIALIDYVWQRYRHERDLKMTKQEVKEEMRRMEGDPLVKQRQRKMQYARVLQQIRTAVPKADVVVTNPTELAIAIQYDAKEMTAPKVVAKGQDHLARKIREIAVLHGIPIVQRRPLAQALFKLVEVGQEVPEQFYKAIAEILAYVYRLSGKKPRRAGAA